MSLVTCHLSLVTKIQDLSPKHPMPIVFKITALILGLAAAGLWYFKMNDAAFIAAVAGSVSFFLSVRAEVKGRLESK